MVKIQRPDGFRRRNARLPIQIVRPLESTPEPQPQLQPALLRLSAMISQYFTRTICIVPKNFVANKDPETGN
jgi:hypothetical protein